MMFRHKLNAWISLIPSVFTVACTQHLAEQLKYLPQGKSDYFSDGRSDRSPVVNTVAKMEDWKPIDWDLNDLLRAQERYSIYCSVCHDGTGSGYGPVVRRGFSRPPAFASESARSLSDQEIYLLITNGSGSMHGFSSSIPVRDRHLIVGYIRILQLRTRVPRSWLSDADLQRLRESK